MRGEIAAMEYENRAKGFFAASCVTGAAGLQMSGVIAFVLYNTHFLSHRSNGEHLIHLQSPRQLVRDEQHGYLPLQLVDGARELRGGPAVQIAGGLVENEDFRAL